MVELYGPEMTEHLNVIRSISLIHDGAKWRFDQIGEPLPFEETDGYTARRHDDRFSLRLLEKYLAELRVEPFDPGFYLPPGKNAVLVEKHGPRNADVQEYTLAEARAQARIEEPSWTVEA